MSLKTAQVDSISGDFWGGGGNKFIWQAYCLICLCDTKCYHIDCKLARTANESGWCSVVVSLYCTRLIYAVLKYYITLSMKDTEVPDPRSISACNCTCVLTRLSRDSCLQCAFCFVSAYAKFVHEFLTLFHRPCASYL